MDKRLATAAEAIADIPDGATIAIGGFGADPRYPVSLLTALRDRGVKDLCLVTNSLGGPGAIRGQALVENKQVSRLIAAFSARPGMYSVAEDLIGSGQLSVELVPQGTLVERCRAGGAGIAAFFSPVGVGTTVADGKEIRYFDGKPFLLEEAIRVDYAFLQADRADRMGNVQFFGGNLNFNLAFAKAARVAIVEADEIVEPGAIAPTEVNLSAIFVSRVVKGTERASAEELASSRPPRRAAETGRSYNGKPGLKRHDIARRAAQLIADGSTVNLGAGLPILVSNYLQDRDVTLHAENGVLGYTGFMSEADLRDKVLGVHYEYNAGGQFVALGPGSSFFDSVTSFEMARGGHLNAVILGAYQVDQEGNLANYATPAMQGGGIGGAMDLVAGKNTLIICMEHRDSDGRPKLLRQCTYPLTGRNCVDVVVTDLALLRRTERGFVLDEVAPGFTPEEVVELTEMELTLSQNIETMSL